MPELNKAEFQEIAGGFEANTKYPSVACAIGTQYYNYKNNYSIILLGRYMWCELQILYFSVGFFGSESDGGVFQDCSVGQSLEAEEIDFSQSRTTTWIQF